MSVRISWDVSSEDFEDSQELLDFLIETLNLVNPHGTRGITLWLGPVSASRDDMPLRLDLDPEPGAEPVASIDAIAELPEVTLNTVGAASARWLPDDLTAVDPAFTGSEIAVMEDSGQELSIIRAELVRISIPTAIDLALEYFQSGSRPANVHWQVIPPVAGS